MYKPPSSMMSYHTHTIFEEEKFKPSFWVFLSEFQKYSVPEDLIPLSGFALPGLASFPQVPHLFEDDLGTLDPLPNLSPVKMPKCTGML